jgi:hypothetical protein
MSQSFRWDDQLWKWQTKKFDDKMWQELEIAVYLIKVLGGKARRDKDGHPHNRVPAHEVIPFRDESAALPLNNKLFN